MSFLESELEVISKALSIHASMLSIFRLLLLLNIIFLTAYLLSVYHTFVDKRNKIAILGFGVEGKAVLSYLLKHRFHNLTVCDKNVDLKVGLPDGVSAILGPEYLDDLSGFDVIFRTPGIPFLHPQIQLARKNGAIVTSCSKFFVEHCPCPIVGVTGTKGKGTTCALIFEMLKRNQENVFLGGNMGNPPIDFIDELKGDDLVVLELSSFQLQDLKKSPRYAVLLNTTSDHLDYHVDVDEYMQAKEGVLAHQTEDSLAVLNKDYEYVIHYKVLVKGGLKWVSVKGKISDGAFVENDFIYFSEKGKKSEIIGVSEVKLVGSHNLENILPAIVIAKELGVSDKDIAEVLRIFENLPHRLEFVREFKGVRFYNDSCSTTPETSMAAVDSFDVPTVLIAGGRDKGGDYDDWALKILTKPNLQTVVLIGEFAEEMEKALVAAEEKLGDAEGSPTKILRRNSMEEAVLDAYAECESGGVVVLSPGATSFDMYKNYKERGEDFKKWCQVQF